MKQSLFTYSLLQEISFNVLTLGIRVIPPTSKTSPISDFSTLASCIAFLHGSTVLLISGLTRVSNLALVSFKFICFGPLASIVKYGKLISVCKQQKLRQLVSHLSKNHKRVVISKTLDFLIHLIRIFSFLLHFLLHLLSYCHPFHSFPTPLSKHSFITLFSFFYLYNFWKYTDFKYVQMITCNRFVQVSNKTKSPSRKNPSYYTILLSSQTAAFARKSTLPALKTKVHIWLSPLPLLNVAMPCCPL